MASSWGDSWGAGGGSAATAAEIADAVWDEILSGHAIAGSTGKALADILGKTNTLGSGTVTFVSPVSADGEEMYLVSGDTYEADQGRSLDFTIAAGFPNLTGATIAFNVNSGQLVVAGSVLVAGAGAQQVRVQLTSAQTGGLDHRQYQYDIRATLSDGDKVTLLHGTLHVADSQAS